MRRWRLHIDHPWSECVRQDGAPMRIYFHTPGGVWMLGEKSQVYDRRTKTYTERFAHLVFHPRARR